MKLVKGVLMQNFIYLVVFYIMYFALVAITLYFKTEICAISMLSTYCAAIPSGTVGMMNFLLFVLVPLLAAIWTFRSSSEPQQQNVG
jgi:hypothetical protein